MCWDLFYQQLYWLAGRACSPMLWQVIKNEIFTPDCSGPWLIMTISMVANRVLVETVYLSAKDNRRRRRRHQERGKGMSVNEL